MAVSTTKKTTTRKTAAAKDSTVEIKVPEIDMEAVVAAGTEAKAKKPGLENALKKKGLVERVAKLTGGKKNEVREIVEATLTALGEALQAGEALNLPPFGRAKISRAKGEGKDASLTVRVRGAGEKVAARPKKQPLAEVGEAS